MTEAITITNPVTIAYPGMSKGARTGPLILTERMCEKRVDQRTKYYDRKCPGLYVSINVDGVATFSLRYTDRFTGKRKNVWLGVYIPGHYTVDDARTEVYALKARIGMGENVFETLHQRKVLKTKQGMTVDELIEARIAWMSALEKKADSEMRPRIETWENIASHLRRFVSLKLGAKIAAEGNLTMEREALTLEALAIAMAAHNSGGIVIAQVERIAESRSLNPRQVKIPGILVDCVVVAKPENHWQTFGTQYNPAYSSEIRVRSGSLPSMQMSERKIIARRAAFELKPNSIVNLGIGMPEGIASVANEEKLIDLITLTAEPGVIGGIPASGIDFGAAVNTQAVIDQPYQFDFYDGGGLDVAFLGLAQVDRAGNLNVSKFGPKLAGAGGFINISQNAKKVTFVGTFGAGRQRIELSDGKLVIVEEAKACKFVNAVEHVTFSGAYAAARGQSVLYVTERCVFALKPEGLELVEVAPGIDIERDILALMAFRPMTPRDPVLMDARIFRPGVMNLREDLVAIPLDQRFTLDEQQNLFFVNLERFALRSRTDIDAIARTVEAKLGGLNRRVYAIVNYDNFSIVPELLDEYSAMVRSLTDRFYSGVSRYTTSGFLRIKLGEALERRGLAPHIFESAEEAQSDWRHIEGDAGPDKPPRRSRAARRP